MASYHPPCLEGGDSIGDILVTYGLSPEELTRALQYQMANEGILLGEACVLLGFIDRTLLETAVRAQKASREHSTDDLIRLATERTRTMADAVGELAVAHDELAEKIK